MELSYNIGSGYKLSAKSYNGDRIVHIRWYKEDNGRTFPTKKGVCLTPMRFSALVDLLDDVDKAYARVSSTADAWETLHLGGPLYVSVKHGFGCINIRYFFKADDGRVLPTKQGVALSLPVWRELKKAAVDLKQQDPILKSAERCGWGDLLHQNQLGFVDCAECNPFYDYMQPAILPPIFSPFLQSTPVEAVLPPTTERLKKRRRLTF